MAEKFSLKDELFNEEKIHKIASDIKEIFPSFNQLSFEQETLEKFPNLELKERIYHIRDMLQKYIALDYSDAIKLLLKSLPPPLDNQKNDNDFGDFIYASYADFVVTFGCNREHLKVSLEALREITKRFSVEFSIREFINQFPKETLFMLEACSLSNNYHERRLATEGLRPKLPWAKKITIDYLTGMKLLDNLYMDNTRYVTRSIANHLNDISKINSVCVIETLKRWKKSQKQNDKEMKFIMTHALRSLVKKGNQEALSLLGYNSNVSVELIEFRLEKTEIKVGENLEFSCVIKSKYNENLIIDYLIFFKTKTGKLAVKVYKLKKVILQKNKKITLLKKHLFKKNMTTRKFYRGEHQVALQINGKVYAKRDFILEL